MFSDDVFAPQRFAGGGVEGVEVEISAEDEDFASAHGRGAARTIAAVITAGAVISAAVVFGEFEWGGPDFFARGGVEGETDFGRHAVDFFLDESEGASGVDGERAKAGGGFGGPQFFWTGGWPQGFADFFGGGAISLGPAVGWPGWGGGGGGQGQQGCESEQENGVFHEEWNEVGVMMGRRESEDASG